MNFPSKFKPREMTFNLKLSQLISMQGRWTMLGQHSPFSFMHLCFRIRQPVISLLNTAGSPNNWRLRDQPIHGHLSWDTVIHIQSQPEGFIANSYLLKIKLKPKQNCYSLNVKYLKVSIHKPTMNFYQFWCTVLVSKI